MGVEDVNKKNTVNILRHGLLVLRLHQNMGNIRSSSPNGGKRELNSSQKFKETAGKDPLLRDSSTHMARMHDSSTKRQAVYTCNAFF